ncbi:MAG: hypothetical protein PHN88_07370 [Ignavibacteria bacterium]|nr:hypothetical protein [Ignavibacteria bacterium]
MYNYYISCISWEERTLLGYRKSKEKYQLEKKIFLYFDTYVESKLKNLREIGNSENEIMNLDFNDPVGIWENIKSRFFNEEFRDKNILLDISTMPRESIWLILLFLSEKTSKIDFIYYKPQTYDDGLLCFNPLKPRLVFKMSGIVDVKKPNLLIAVAGFDFERIDAIKNKYEPKDTIIFYHPNDDYRNGEINEKIKKRYNLICDLKEVNSYNSKELFCAISRIIDDRDEKYYHENYNIICASLGPKPSAISMFNLWKKYNKIALCYVPALDYNLNYSHGIKEKSVIGSALF